MERIKMWFKDHEILSVGLLMLVLNGIIGLFIGFFDKTYEKNYPNECSYELALGEFNRIVSGYIVDKNDDCEFECHKYYDNKNEAVNDFMNLVLVYDGLYANGKIRHIYLSGKERIYRCCDRNKNRIAVRLLKHRRMGLNWKPEYELDFFVEKY